MVSHCSLLLPEAYRKVPAMISETPYFWWLKVIWSIGKGQKSFESIPICLISTWKHIMYA